MCGIAGFVDTKMRAGDGGAPAERAAVLDRMCRVIRHRGPDDQGTAIEGDAALGMRRLSIIDLAGGHQPIYNEDRTLAIVFNGEIYNYRELYDDLARRGHEFRTRCDTETIVHLYEEHGAACVDHLRGMFAFAIWDERKQELFIARDRVGKKPLYYTTTRQGTFVFGSELKSLLEHPEVEARTSLLAVDAYLAFGYVPDPLSIFDGIYKLPPGCRLKLAGGRVGVEQYWDFGYTDGRADAAESAANEEDALAELCRLLDEAVRVRLISEVPLGAFLSGGVDSSTVVGLMARNMTQPVKTFSIGFNEDSYDELKFARLAAAHFKTDHHEFVVTPDICRITPDLVRSFDEPFADSSAIPTYMVSKLAREHVTVALSGDGGDELFAGYTRYVTDQGRAGWSRLPRSVRRHVMQPLSRRLPHGARGRNFIHDVALDPLARYIESVSIFGALAKESLYTPEFRRRLEAARRAASDAERAATDFEGVAERATTGEPLDRLLYLDSKTYLPGDILTKVDRTSMAVSLETRAPLLDHKLIDFVSRLPAGWKLREGETKAIMKRAVEDFVPREILYREKQGFGVPLQHWINRELRDELRDTLTSRRSRERGYFDPTHIDLLFGEHERGRRDHSTALWTLFILELWHRAYADGAPEPVQAEETPVSVNAD